MYSSANTVHPTTDCSFPSSCSLMKRCNDVFESGTSDIFEAVPPVEWVVGGLGGLLGWGAEVEIKAQKKL